MVARYWIPKAFFVAKEEPGQWLNYLQRNLPRNIEIAKWKLSGNYSEQVVLVVEFVLTGATEFNWDKLEEMANEEF